MDVTMDDVFDVHDVSNSTGYTRSGEKSSPRSDFATSDLETQSKDGEQDRACRDSDACEIILPSSGPILRNADVTKMFLQLSEDVWIGFERPRTETMRSCGAKITAIDHHRDHLRDEPSMSPARAQILVQPNPGSDSDFTTWNKNPWRHGQIYDIGELAYLTPNHGMLHGTSADISIFQTRSDFGLFDMDELHTRAIEFLTGRAHKTTIQIKAQSVTQEAPPGPPPTFGGWPQSTTGAVATVGGGQTGRLQSTAGAVITVGDRPATKCFAEAPGTVGDPGSPAGAALTGEWPQSTAGAVATVGGGQTCRLPSTAGAVITVGDRPATKCLAEAQGTVGDPGSPAEAAFTFGEWIARQHLVAFARA